MGKTRDFVVVVIVVIISNTNNDNYRESRERNTSVYACSGCFELRLNGLREARDRRGQVHVHAESITNETRRAFVIVSVVVGCWWRLAWTAVGYTRKTRDRYYRRRVRRSLGGREQFAELVATLS